MSSAKQAPRPQTRQECQPVDSGRLVFPQGGLQGFARAAWQPGSADFSNRLATGLTSRQRRQRTNRCISMPCPSSPRSAGAPASSRMPSLNDKPSVACSSMALQCRSASCNFSRSTSTHCPFNRTSPSSLLSRASNSSGVSSCIAQSDIHSEVQHAIGMKPTSASALPMVAPTRGRGRFFHQSGRRTVIPLCSSTGTSLRN